MSLSSNQERNLTGKVVMGMHTPGPDEMTIQEIEGKRQLLWDETIDQEYLERVKTKAKAKAKEIIMMAELEAEALRATAHHEGYEEGIARAQLELDQTTEGLTQRVESVMSQIGAQGATLFDERRGDIIALIKLAVEKTLSLELSENRVASLESLLKEALDRLESQRQIVIKCHPDDVPDMEGFVATVQKRNPALKYWSVKADPSIKMGGLLLESADGKVDNTIASRWKGVEPILDQLSAQVTASKAEG